MSHQVIKVSAHRTDDRGGFPKWDAVAICSCHRLLRQAGRHVAFGNSPDEAVRASMVAHASHASQATRLHRTASI